MFIDIIEPHQELFIIFSKKALEAIFNTNSNLADCVFIYYTDSRLSVDLALENKDTIIDCTKDSEYTSRYYSIIKPTKEEENKILTLLNVGLSIEEIICEIFLRNKINDFKWKGYKS